MDRAAGSRSVPGNAIHLQFEGTVTFEEWIEAIQGARSHVHFENYILRDDPVGRRFRDALIERARAGVQVRVLHDWFGCWATPRRYWRPFREAGVEVRAFNPPAPTDPLGILQRDHRKLICVDGRKAFVGGLCIGEEWSGNAHLPPWRDTGIEIRGPAALAADQAFERIWREAGGTIPEAIAADPSLGEAVGSVPVWLIEGVPFHTRVYRVAQMMATGARERIWITDPYFVAPRPVADALAAAARDGVDVRILVPAHNNWPWVGSLSRGGYRSLLEAGIRIFEWQGPMIHAKTAVVDGTWSRVGSSNLNAASLLGNWEIDVAVRDPGLARQLEGLFLADLASAVEIVLPGGAGAVPRFERRTAPVVSLEPEGSFVERLDRARREQPGGGSTGFRIADLARLGSALGASVAGRRELGREDRTVLGTVSGGLLAIAGVLVIFPGLGGWLLAGVSGWFGAVLGFRAFLQARQARQARRASGAATEGVPPEPSAS